MKVLDFNELYYRTANCFVSNVLADSSPVVRVNGIDKNAGYSVVFTALGSRFDATYVAKEAFEFNEYYESDLLSIDSMPIAEAMRYIRQRCIQEQCIPENYQKLVEDVKARVNLFGRVTWKDAGTKESDLLFLPGPISQLNDVVVDQFSSVSHRKFYASAEFNDCGYMAMQLGLEALLDEIKADLEEIISSYREIVTDDSYVYDALKCLFPKREGIKFIDEFLYEQNVKKESTGLIAIHEPGVIRRLYPLNIVDIENIIKAKCVYPNRSGYDTSDAGLSGGLGLFATYSWKNMAGQRLKELSKQSPDCIITSCSNEAFALQIDKYLQVKTLLEFLAQF